MSFSPQTGWIYVPINPSSTFSFTAAENFAPDPGYRITNFGGGRGARGQRRRWRNAGALRTDSYAARMATPCAVAS